MALTLSGTGQYLSVASAIISAPPCSFAVWVKAAALAATSVVLSVGNSTDTEDFSSFISTTGAFNGQAKHASVSGRATTASTIATGAWHLICATFTSAASRAIYMDGGNVATNTTSEVPTSLAITSLGANTAAAQLLNGSIAFPTIWNVALSATDVSNLWNGGAGVDPRTIQAGSLASFTLFAPGSVSPWQDSITTVNWTTTGSPTTSADPFSLTPAVLLPVKAIDRTAMASAITSNPHPVRGFYEISKTQLSQISQQPGFIRSYSPPDGNNSTVYIELIPLSQAHSLIIP